MSALIFIVFTLLVFSLPLIPAVHEFIFKTDVAPLEVPVSYDIDPRRFAYNFQKLVYEAAADYLAAGAPISVGQRGSIFKIYDPRAEPGPDANIREILVSRDRVLIPRGAWTNGEIYSLDRVRCRTASHVRAVFSEDVLALGVRACVLRWAHADVVYAMDKNELYGRITADTLIYVRNRAIFERMHAPMIRFGDRHSGARFRRQSLSRANIEVGGCGEVLMNQPDLKRVVFEGNVAIPSNSIVETDLIVRGNLKVGNNVLVLGSLKSRGKMSIGTDCEVRGSAVAQDSLLIGRRTTVLGPAIGERRIVLGDDCSIGSKELPVTVTSNRIDVHNGVVVFGSIWARELGRAVGKLSRKSHSALLPRR